MYLLRKGRRLRFLSIAVISILLLNLLPPIGAFAKNTYGEETVDVIVLYKDEVPKTRILFGIKHENENVLKSLPIKTMTVPVGELNRLINDPTVLSVSLDQEVELARSDREEISILDFEDRNEH